jgi:hypothetical protein
MKEVGSEKWGVRSEKKSDTGLKFDGKSGLQVLSRSFPCLPLAWARPAKIGEMICSDKT